MAAPSLTYTLTNGSTADASQVMQNFNDLLNGITDGTKDLSISALTCAGTATLNGHVNLGNSTADDLTITASLASDIVPKTTGARSLGSSALGFLGLYLAASGDADTARIIAAAHTADRDYTIPDLGANGTFAFLEGAQTFTGLKDFSSAGITAPSSAAGNVYSGTYTPILGDTATNVTAATVNAFQYCRIGNVVHVTGYIFIDPTSASTASTLSIRLPVASNFTSAGDCSGVAAGGQVGVAYLAGVISADTTNDRALIDWVASTDVANRQWTVTFSYIVK